MAKSRPEVFFNMLKAFSEKALKVSNSLKNAFILYDKIMALSEAIGKWSNKTYKKHFFSATIMQWYKNIYIFVKLYKMRNQNDKRNQTWGNKYKENYKD